MKFLTKLVSFLKSAYFLSFLILLLLTAIIWFVGPAFTIYERAPLSSNTTRLLVIMVLIILWGLNNWRLSLRKDKPADKKEEPKDQTSGQDASKTEEVSTENKEKEKYNLPKLNASFRYIYRLSTRLNDRLSNHLGGCKLPWYLVIGKVGSGKSSLLEYTKDFKIFAPTPAAITNIQNISWHLTEQAIFLELSEETANLEKITPLLKKYRAAKILKGIIVAISLEALLGQSDSDRCTYAENLHHEIYQLQKRLKRRFPVTLVFTMADKIIGFQEFFAYLSAQERMQPWGINLSAKKEIANEFNCGIESMITQLNDHLSSYSYQGADQNLAAIIMGFPLQMAHLKTILVDFMRHLAVNAPFCESLNFVGAYFTSAKQQGTAINVLLPIISKTFGLISKVTETTSSPSKETSPKRRLCFIENLFDKIILSTKQRINEPTLELRRTRNLGLVCICSLSLLLLGGSTYIWHAGYHQANTNVALLRNQLGIYSNFPHRSTLNFAPDAMYILKEWPPFTTNNITPVTHSNLAALEEAKLYTLPFLFKLRTLDNYLMQETYWPSKAGLFTTRSLQKYFHRTYILALHKLFIPCLAELMSQQLKFSLMTQDDASAVYQQLRPYLMLADQKHLDPQALKSWLANYEVEHFAANKIIAKNLTWLLDDLLAQPMPPINLDNSLIQHARATINLMPSAERAYAALQQQIAEKNVGVISIPENFLTDFTLIFDLPKQLTISKFYTPAGFRRLYKSEQATIVKNTLYNDWVVAEEDTNVAAKTELTKQMENLYFQDFIDHWQKLLGSLQIRRCATLPQYAAMLKLLANPNSPLMQLLQQVKENTTLTINLGKAPTVLTTTLVDNEFATLNSLSQSADGKAPSPLTGIQQNVIAAYAYINDIKDGTTALAAAKNIIANDAKNPLLILLQQAKDAPRPLNIWLESLAEQGIALIFQTAHQQIRTIWRKTVYAVYADTIAGHYPLAPSSSKEISSEALAAFFAPAGILDTFYQTYALPFLQVQGKDFQLLTVAAQNIGFSPELLAILKAAQQIKSNSFAANNAKPQISLSIKPIDLDANIASAILTVNGQKIIQRHDPQYPVTITWPAQDEASNISSLQLNMLNGQTIRIEKSGLWGFFKLLDSYTVSKQSAQGGYIVVLAIAGHHASYQIQSDNSSQGQTSIGRLRGFNLPENI